MKNAKFSISKIIKLLKEKKLIIDDENELKEYLVSFSPERIINNYSQPFMKNFDLNKNEYNQKDSSKSIIELFNYDKNISSLLFNSIKDIESTFGYKILYFIKRKIDNLSLNENQYDKISYKTVIRWIRTNELTFGEWLRVFEYLNKDLQYLIIGSYKDVNWNTRQFLIIFKELKLLRNMCAHNKTIYNLKINVLNNNINFVSYFVTKNNLKIKIKNRNLKLFDLILIIDKISNKRISIDLKIIFYKKTFDKIINSKFISNEAKEFVLKIIGII